MKNFLKHLIKPLIIEHTPGGAYFHVPHPRTIDMVVLGAYSVDRIILPSLSTL